MSFPTKRIGLSMRTKLVSQGKAVTHSLHRKPAADHTKVCTGTASPTWHSDPQGPDDPSKIGPFMGGLGY